MSRSPFPWQALIFLTVSALSARVFFAHSLFSQGLVRQIGRYDPGSTIPPARRILHLYFTRELSCSGMRGGGCAWTHIIEADIGAGVPLPRSDAGETQFVGYDRAGRVLFVRRTSLVWERQPPGVTYRADVFPAPPAIERRLGRLDVTYGGRTYAQRALPDAPPFARAVAVDASHVRIDLDCTHYSMVRVHYAQDRDLTAASTDALETLRNCWIRFGATALRTPIETRDSALYLDFYNGLLYTDRAVRVEVDGRGNSPERASV